MCNLDDLQAEGYIEAPGKVQHDDGAYDHRWKRLTS